MLTIENLLTQIKIFEGFRTKKYKDCGAGVETIGYGFTKSCFTYGAMPDTITKDEADKILIKEVDKILKDVLLKLHEFKYSDRDIDILLLPLVDFTYNCGMGNLRNLTKAGARTVDEIAQKIVEYNKAGGKVLKGLTTRREWEKSEILANMKEVKKCISGENWPTAQELQTLVNQIYGEDVLAVDGKIGKNTIKYTYELLLKLV